MWETNNMKRDLQQPEEEGRGLPLSAELQDLLKEALKGMKYGQVILIVQDGKVVQIDRTEKVRLTH